MELKYEGGADGMGVFGIMEMISPLQQLEWSFTNSTQKTSVLLRSPSQCIIIFCESRAETMIVSIILLLALSDKGSFVDSNT